MGITFTVYSDGQNIDRAWPFDIIPRVIPGTEWDRISAGLAQRLRALNMFIDDLYNEQRVIADGVFPAELLAASANFRRQCCGVSPKLGVWAHISGTDLVRDDDGVMYVLEDNLRVPSGVSYVLENRAVAKRAFAELFARQQIRPVDGYTDELKRLLISIAPDGVADPQLVVLTPGIYNSAYFEHSFLAQRMGAELVEGADLVVADDDCVYMRTIAGLERVHVIYRRIDDLFAEQSILPVDAYTDELNRMLTSIAPDGVADPTIAVLTPGIYNSAYFEHSYLAQRIGAHLVEGADLTVGDDDCVYLRTIDGRERVHVIYRRVDDLFLDPEVFRPDSQLGVRGLMRAWKAGNVAIANAPGAGVADDKVVYAWVPDLIRYYLGEEPLLPNVPTYRCVYDDERKFVLDNIGDLVLKPANESGGYGLLIGNRATAGELEAHAARVEADPRNWVAQPILALSTAPTLCDGSIEPRHVDLRPFVLSGERQYVTAGGLTRVALRRGSLVVNSSQGGGSKDTWIVEE